MNCPKCGKSLPENLSLRINFCPLCGEKLFEAGKKYLIEIHCAGQRDAESPMMVFLDDKMLYEVVQGESICFPADAGFHAIKFRHKIRSKSITLLVTHSYVIKAYYNTLSGLIETNVTIMEDSRDGIDDETLAKRELTAPVMVSEDGRKSFDILLGDDDPEYELKGTSGLKEGILRIYTDRCEFAPSSQNKKEVLSYKNVLTVKKKMGSIELVCDGNVHKVYSIPKDIYNEVLAFLTNRISEVQGHN